MHHRLTAFASVVLIGLAAPAHATFAGTAIEDAAQALRNDSVYVDPNAARAISDGDADDLRAAIGNADTPIYLAVLSASAADSAGGDPDEVARQLAESVDRPGTYGVVVGDSFRAGSSEMPAGRAGELAEAALATSDDTAAVLIDFVGRVSAAATEATNQSDGTGNGAASSVQDDDGAGSGWVLPIVLGGGAAVGGLLWWRSRRHRAERKQADAADRGLLSAEISVLASDVVRYETDVQVHPDARGDFDAAVNRYRAAQAAIEHADEPIDLVRVERVVAEARYSMDRVKAIIEGREPPAPPDELQRQGRHGEPAVTLDEHRQPAYVGYPGGYGGGWFGGMGGGLFSGLLIGSMLGGGFGHWGGGQGDTTIVNDDGGDSGGGDFGGGDFGGGDLGGGDFGGGDFGGGDF